VVRRIEWTRQGLNDLSGIYEFIARDSKCYAQIQVENILGGVSKLATFPLMGRRVPEFPHLRYREIVVGAYRVLYRFEEKQNRIVVASIVHGRRLLKEPLA